MGRKRQKGRRNAKMARQGQEGAETGATPGEGNLVGEMVSSEPENDQKMAEMGTCGTKGEAPRKQCRAP